MPHNLNDSQRREVESLCERLLSANPKEIDRTLSDCDDRSVCEAVRRLLEVSKRLRGETRNVEQLLDMLRPPAELGDDPTLEGTRIDRYRIDSVLGRGGFGVVYRATQTHPVERTVAIKVLRPGFGSGEVFARFESERQALAMMDHPYIARIFDAGAMPDGRPYFVMEHVRGSPVTGYCNDRTLGANERLDLFIGVCEAVAHAHAKGVIHRDLKPNNVLIDEDTGRPVVIDFGIAKALDQSLTDMTIATRHGMLIGTPEYMSPEQTGLNPGLADTRSDVYSLGVLLYELLTGRLPFDRDRLKKADLITLQRIIKEEAPPKPSTRLSTQSRTRDASDSTGRTPVPCRQVTGDLDWIVMRCLEKDPDRRYPTAESLVADIRRYRNNKPVEAGPPSVRYRVGKFVRRHRVPVVAGAAVVLSLVAGLTGTLVFASGQARALTIAEQRQRELEKIAGYQASVIESLDASEFGVRMREELRSSLDEGLARERPDPEQAESIRSGFQEALDRINPSDVSRTTLASTYLRSAAERLATEFDGQPVLEAAVRSSLARASVSLGVPDLANEQQQRAFELLNQSLGTDHPDTLTAIADLEQLRVDAEQEGARDRLRAALETAMRELGESAHATRKLAVIYGGAMALIENEEAEHWLALAARSPREPDEPPDDVELAAMDSLVFLFNELDRLNESEEIAREALALCESRFGLEHPKTFVAMNSLGNVLRRQGRHTDAHEVFLDAFERSTRVLGVTHPDTLTYAYSLTRAIEFVGERPRAVQLGRDTYSKRLETLGPNHPDTAASAVQIAFFASSPKEKEEAFREAARVYRLTYGPDHPYVHGSMMNVGTQLRMQNRIDESVEILQGVLKARLRIYGEEHLETITARFHLGVTLRMAERYDESEVELALAHDGYTARRGPNSYEALLVASEIGILYRIQDPLRGIELLEKVGEGLHDLVGPCHGLYTHVIGQLVQAHVDLGQFEEGVDVIREYTSFIDSDMSEGKRSGCLDRIEDFYRLLAKSDTENTYQPHFDEVAELRMQFTEGTDNDIDSGVQP